MKPLRYGNTSIGERLKSIQVLVNTNGLHVNKRKYNTANCACAHRGRPPDDAEDLVDRMHEERHSSTGRDHHKKSKNKVKIVDNQVR